MRFVDEHRDRYAVALLLRVLDIEPSTYYGWLGQAQQPCDRDEVDRGLLEVPPLSRSDGYLARPRPR